jgi:repressor LexA
MNIRAAISKIQKFFRLNRRLPSYSEMAKLMGYSSKNASYYLVKKLIGLGIITKDGSGHLLLNKLTSPLPFLGSIKAGSPTAVDNLLNESMTIEDLIINKPEKSFLLKVSGDSMIGAGIHEGDWVVVETKKEPINGDIVAAQLEGEWTLKFYEHKNGKIRLIPANPKYRPIIPGKESFIGGVVVAQIRKYH